MKKTILVTILILFVTVMAAFPGETRKPVKYETVQAFMENYYNDYNLYSQDAATIDLMDEYWAPEFLSIQYLPLPQPLVFDLATWKYFLVGVHSNFIETLTLNELSIDTKKLTAVARVKVEFHNRITNELIVSVDGIGFYNLKAEKKCGLKMTCLKIYFSNPAALMAISGPPPGM